MRVTMVIFGPPIPKARARACADGRHRTPKRTRAYEQLVKTIAFLSLPPDWPLNDSYRVTLHAYMPDERARDIDNVCKSFLDGCNRVVWNDDSQVESLTATRSVDRDYPRCEVVVESLGKPREAKPKRARTAQPRSRAMAIKLPAWVGYKGGRPKAQGQQTATARDLQSASTARKI